MLKMFVLLHDGKENDEKSESVKKDTIQHISHFFAKLSDGSFFTLVSQLFRTSNATHLN
jgi:hypothetical protein